MKDCAHAPMISDETLIDYLKYEVYGKNDDNMWSDSKTNALNNFKDKNFVDECNNDLYNIAHEEK